MLNRPLLWTPCRHHIGEIIISRVWDSLKIEVAKSPEVSVFQRLRTHFPKLSYSDHTDLCYIDVEKELQPAKEETIKLIKEVLGNKKFAYRGNYTRFLNSVLALLTGDTTDFKLEGLGAISSARWMAKETGAIDLFLIKDI